MAHRRASCVHGLVLLDLVQVCLAQWLGVLLVQPSPIFHLPVEENADNPLRDKYARDVKLGILATLVHGNETLCEDALRHLVELVLLPGTYEVDAEGLD